MSNSKITFRAIAPIYSPLSLKLGVDQFSKTFVKSLRQIDLKQLTDLSGRFHSIGGLQNEERQYQSTDENSKDVRLMCWSPKDKDDVVFNVFANNIAIAEVELNYDSIENTQILTPEHGMLEALEDRVQTDATKIIEAQFEAFCEDLKKLHQLLSNDFLYARAESAEISWIARTIVFNEQQLIEPEFGELLKVWLAKTNRPEDAQDIIDGKLDYSLSWLNYAVKNPEPVGQEPYLQMMVLCQYYYVSQEHCNSELRTAIELAYARTDTVKIDKVLAKRRTASRLNQIAFFENIKFLTRPNRKLLEDILNGWKYEQLVENAERMIEVCDAKLQEEDNRKREKSSVMTDFLLVALSFFAVFELSLYLTEFSREMMSRPALDYNDSKSSFFLGFIAEIDADIMFSFGFGLTLFLIIVYRYIKRN